MKVKFYLRKINKKGAKAPFFVGEAWVLGGCGKCRKTLRVSAFDLTKKADGQIYNLAYRLKKAAERLVFGNEDRGE